MRFFCPPLLSFNLMRTTFQVSPRFLKCCNGRDAVAAYKLACTLEPEHPNVTDFVIDEVARTESNEVGHICIPRLRGFIVARTYRVRCLSFFISMTIFIFFVFLIVFWCFPCAAFLQKQFLYRPHRRHQNSCLPHLDDNLMRMSRWPCLE